MASLTACTEVSSSQPSSNRFEAESDETTTGIEEEKEETTQDDAGSEESAEDEATSEESTTGDSSESSDEEDNNSTSKEIEDITTEIFPGVEPQSLDAGGFPEIRSELPRDKNPDASLESLRTILTSNNDLGFDLIRFLANRDDGNLAVSPVSIHAAMALLLAAATDDTQRELVAANGFLDDVDQTHAALSRISMQLAALQQPKSRDYDPVILTMANRIFLNPGARPKPSYLDLMAKYYGTGAYEVPLRAEPKESKNRINQWVSENTQSRIKDLLPEGSINGHTSWVFVNALYFKAPWAGGTFSERNTRLSSFKLASGSTIKVPMMRGTQLDAHYGETEELYWGSLQLGKTRNLRAAFLLPKQGKLADVLSNLSSKKIETLFRKARHCELSIQVPKFKIITPRLDLTDFYKERGAQRTFGDGGSAQLDGLGIDDTSRVKTLVHKVFFAADERGVEGAAATAGVVGRESDDEPIRCDPMRLDRPFFFLIYDTRSKVVLFAGRVMNPAA